MGVQVRLSVIMALAATFFFVECATSRETSDTTKRNFAHAKSISGANACSSTDVNDSIHAGGTKSEERDSERRQVHLVAIVVFYCSLGCIRVYDGNSRKGRIAIAAFPPARHR